MATQHDISLRRSDIPIVIDSRHKGFTGDYTPISNYRKDTWKVGDIIRIEQHSNYDYRNGGKLIWNGTTCESLDHDIDDYGSMTKNFAVGNNDWTAQHWADVIDHNHIVYASFNPELNGFIKEVYNGIDEIPQELKERYAIQVIDMNVNRNDFLRFKEYDETIKYRTIRFRYNGNIWGIVMRSSETYTSHMEPWDAEPFENVNEPSAFNYLNDEYRYYFVPGVDTNRTLFYGYLD